MRKVILISSLLLFAFGSSVLAQDKVDTRIWSQSYWLKMAQEGLVPFNPNVEPPPPVYLETGDGIDVPTADDPNITQSENSVFVNPLDHNKAFNSNNSTNWPVTILYATSNYHTSDGGATWSGTFDLPGAGSNSGDPATSIDLNGRYFVGYINNGFGQGVAYSDNEGTSWTNVTIVGSGLEDKNHLMVDNWAASPYEGNLYSAWTAFSTTSDIVISRSTNGGTAWSSPVDISLAVAGGSHDQGVNVQIGPEGQVYAIWTIYDCWPCDETAIGFSRSLDGGATYETASRIITNIRGIRQEYPSTFPHRVSSFPSMAVDPSGTIHIVWVNHGVPGVNTGNDRDVYYIRSTDEGATWSTPARVHTDPIGMGEWHYYPWITSDPVTGALSVVYYDTRNTAQPAVETWVSTSIDAGNTWEDFRVSDVAFTPAPIPGLAGGYMGDYLAIAARSGKVYPVWTDNRTGVALSYTSPFDLATNVGWVQGIVDDGTNPLEDVTITFDEATIQIPGNSDATGYYLAAAEVDTLVGSQQYTLRAQKFGYLDYTSSVTLILGDTIDHNVTMATAPGGTLMLHAHTNDGSGIGADVEILLGGDVVVTGSTDPGTGDYTTPLPSGTYDVVVDPASPYGTETFIGVVITANNTTNIDALIQYVLDPSPVAMAETLVVGQISAQTLTLTNTTDEDIPFRITDDNIETRIWMAPPAKQPPDVPKARPQGPKGAKDMKIGPPQYSGAGGPDEFGYRWIDSDEPGGPVFDWVDITGVGTSLIMTDDLNLGPFNLGFDFTFYGNTYNSIRVVSNGFLSFTSTSNAYSNVAIPDGFDPDNALYPYWDDLNPGNGGQIHYYADAANSQFIVQYTDVPYFSGTGDVTFQVILRPNNEVLFQYLDMGGTVTSATVGIENADGSVGLQVVFNAAYIHNDLATRFFLPNATWLSQSPESGTVLANSTQDVLVTFDANGLDVGTTYNANMSISATHPDAEDDIIVPASLTTELADSAVLLLDRVIVDFPVTQVNDTSVDSVLARNGGGTTLNITDMSTTNPEFVVTPDRMMLDPLDSAYITITYTPTTEETDTGRVIILSNSQGSSRIDVILNGEALGAPHFVVEIDSLQMDLEGGLIDSILFDMGNDGTASGDFSARAILTGQMRNAQTGKQFRIPSTLFTASRDALPVHSRKAVTQKRGKAASTPAARGGFAEAAPLSAPAGPPVPPAQNDPWDLQFSFDVEDATGALGNAGTEYDGTYYYTTRWASNLIHQFDMSGNLIKEFSVPGVTGLRDLAWDGQYMYGGAAGFIIYQMDFISETLMGTIPTAKAVRHIAYDGGADGFWIGTWADNPDLVNRSGGTITTLTTGLLSQYGSAYDDYSDGGPYLWVFDQGSGSGFPQVIYQFDLNTLTPTGFTYDVAADFPTTFGIAGGLWIGEGIVPGLVSLGGLLQGTPDMFFVYELTEGGGGGNWFSIKPTSGTIPIAGSQLMTATFDASSPEIYENPGNYFGEVQVTATNSSIADTLTIPVRLYVVPPAGARLTVTPTELDFGNVEIGSSDTMAIRVRNIGASSLDVTDITTDEASFTVIGPTSFTLATFDTQWVEVSFNAVEPEGEYTGTMTFTSNDPSAPTVPLTGFAEGAAHIAVNPQSFEFTLTGTDTSVQTMMLYNTGTATLDYEINEGLATMSREDIKASIARSKEQQYVPATVEKGKENTAPGQPPVEGTGGPDEFGYIWIDSDEPGGPAFEWDDISGVGTALVMTDDDNQGPFSLGFDFSFYGTTYNSVRVCSNGWVSFTSTSTAYINTAIPASADPNNAIYGFWDDMNPSLGGTIHYYADAMNNRFIVQWTDILHFGSGGPYTYQIIIKSNGEMLTQYLSITPPDDSNTIGIENADGSIGLQVVFDAAYVHDNLAILFTRDLIPWMSADPVMGSVNPGDSVSVDIRVHPEGLASGMYAGNFVITGNTSDVVTVPVTLDLTTSVEELLGLPTVYSLSQNYPNPFNPETKIKYSIPEQATVSLKIYNLLGQEVASLATEVRDAGYYEVVWNGRNRTGAVVGTGVYFYRFEATGVSGKKFTDLKKMIFLK